MKIEIGITHWANFPERVGYLDRCLAAIRVKFASLPVVVSIEPDECSGFNDQSREVCEKYRGVQVIQHPVKSPRVDGNLDFLSDYVFDDLAADFMLYVQDDFLIEDIDLPLSLKIMKLRPLCVAVRYMWEGEVKLSVPGGASSFAVTDPESVHFWSYNPALHSPKLRERCGRFDNPEHGQAWEWKYSKRMAELAKLGDVELLGLIGNRCKHIGDVRTIECEEQYIDENDFAISSALLNYMRRVLPAGSTVLELGSGVGSNALARHFKMVCVEEWDEWVNRFDSLRYVHAPLDRRTAWYDLNVIRSIDYPEQPAALLIDGPNTTRGNRQAVLSHLDLLPIDAVKVIVIDDTHRGHEQALASQLVKRLKSDFPSWANVSLKTYADAPRAKSSFSVLTRSPDDDDNDSHSDRSS